MNIHFTAYKFLFSNLAALGMIYTPSLQLCMHYSCAELAQYF